MGRRRAIALWALVIAGAAWRYVADGYAPFDPCRARFAFDPDHGTLADVPAAVRRLDGRAVAVEGFMVPIDPADPIEHFALEPSIYSGPGGLPPPRDQDVVFVDLATPQPYRWERVRVYGRLHVRVERDDGYLLCLYRLEATRLEPAAADPISRWPLAALGSAGLAAVGWGMVRHRRRQWL